jgi:hypothetical protein
MKEDKPKSALSPSVETAKKFIREIPKKAKKIFSGEFTDEQEKKKILKPEGITGARG